MKDSFTFSDLILFSDNESSKILNVNISRDLKSGDEQFLPDKRIINNILSYSRALNVIKINNAGNINLLMN
ncbi:MAG: hypothetical protein K8S16_05105 [Bacteroidales bacterium]|nr:hypothetical protein [Bacteroidales bacterium]